MGGDLILDEEAREQSKHEKGEEQGRGRGDDDEAGKHSGAANQAVGKHEQDEEGGGGGKYETVANKTSGGSRS
ncbi:hypothetical protein LR48_Vigan09g221300 [Vigna angularis]|uniref:Uncharacterized protein n=1 Tax=Phaseolus angularis TaxID=3914 RepID=A0A0L9VFV5_PHAAN|nr:hypothetical protein LR48_Vigan09g221300 [Vigna angularis]